MHSVFRPNDWCCTMTRPAPYRYPGGRILVFARAPVPGAVKTRLAAGIGAEAAARLHMQWVRDRLDMLVAAQLAPVELHVAPDATHAMPQADAA